MYGSVSEAISIDLANALLFLSFAVTWTGARVFDGRPPLPMYLVAGPVVWLIVAASAELLPAISMRASCSPPASSPPTPGSPPTSSGAAAASRWSRAGPRSSCCSRTARCSCCARRSSPWLPWSPTNQVFDSVWLTVLSFEALLFTIAIAFILLAMAKERTELRHKTAAMVDPLTGIANRRAFLQDGTELMKRHGTPIRVRPRVLLIDLDHFKSINDRFGHAIGDRVLQVFADTAQRATLALVRSDRPARRRGVRGRALRCRAGKRRWRWPSASARPSPRRRARSTAGRSARPSASASSIARTTSRSTCRRCSAQADQALYFAKERGRNRVEVATLDLVLGHKDAVNRFGTVAAKSAA